MVWCSLMLSSSCCLAARPGAHVDKIDALFVAQFSRRKRKVTQRNLGYKVWLQRIGHVERAAYGLSAVWRTWQLVLFMGDVQQGIFWVGPQTVRLAALTEKGSNNL